ncbi:restriction endonuclease subunit S [Lactococcus petauri]|uniref:restriction endonuclease subunit S n=1 Tax=Lactococcus petauri TaxID=1940789 RepID=UPI002891510C|nr:restriction endonuclease subunit S [Lactococcus petauri]MDT2576126.1 restriction endonuclease subunit S [Lactococcus petauri]MDT2586797.1 restriction endonuclease subunit S [Lactococcus petauri]
MAKIDDSVKKKVPELRFKGFTDEWEERKFDECFNFPVSTNSLSRALLNYDEGDIKSVHYGDILIKYPAILNIKNDKIPYITGGKLEKYKSSLLENGDLIFADAAEDETVGKAVEVNGLTEENLVAGLHTIVARPKDKKAEFFLGYYINSNTYHRQLLRLIQGSKVSSISKGNLQKTLVSFPKDFEEQQKIGSFFKQLDDTIALHQHKLDLLKEQKKGYLQKMFPKNGAKVPELRFAGFADDWEDRKLIEVADYRNGKAHEKDISEYGDYIVVNSKFVSTNGLVKKYSDEMIAPLSKNEIAFVLSDVPNGRAIARTFLINEDNKYSLNQRIAGITPHADTNSYFLHSLMNRNHYFLRFDDGVSQTNLSKKEVEKWVEFYPSYEEQQKIGAFFKHLDDTIALHQRKLDLLKEQKKGFLQKMFV